MGICTFLGPRIWSWLRVLLENLYTCVINGARIIMVPRYGNLHFSGAKNLELASRFIGKFVYFVINGARMTHKVCSVDCLQPNNLNWALFSCFGFQHLNILEKPSFRYYLWFYYLYINSYGTTHSGGKIKRNWFDNFCNKTLRFNFFCELDPVKFRLTLFCRNIFNFCLLTL
jgi:hypothetical protein